MKIKNTSLHHTIFIIYALLRYHILSEERYMLSHQSHIGCGSELILKERYYENLLKLVMTISMYYEDSQTQLEH